jgi:uncharacterized protein (TIGR03545 family)
MKNSEVKIPKLFKKTFSEEEFNKRIQSKLYIHEYKNFINNAFIKDESSNYRLKEDLNKKEIRTLKKIAKSIKSNTGYILRGRIALILILLGGIIFFNVIFKDKLIERVAEKGLERIFEARADIRGLKLRIFNTGVYFKSLEVADSEDPFRNLFEMGKTEINLDLPQILRGKIILNNIEFQEIQWGTKRTTSGALPGTRVKVGEEEVKRESFAIIFLKDADSIVSEIIRKEMDNIKSIKLMKELPGDYIELKDKWSNKIENHSGEIDDLKEIISPVTDIRIDKINTLDNALSAYKKVETAYNGIKSVESNLKNSHEEFKNDLNKAKNDRERVENTIKNDYEYLSSFIISAGKRKSISNAILEGFLQKYLGRVYDRVKRWYYYFDKLKPLVERNFKTRGRVRAKGRNVTFPSVGFPRFWLKNAGFSIGSWEMRNIYEINAKDITSDHNLIDKPTTFYILKLDGKKEIKWSGLIDGRRKKEKAAEFKLGMKYMPFNLSEGIKSLNIEGMDCNYNMEGGISFDNLNRAGGTFAIRLFDVKLDLIDKNDLIAKNLKEVLSENPVDIKVGYTVSENGDYKMSINSNLDELISGIVNKLASEVISEAEKKLKEKLNELLNPYLEKYQEKYKEVIGLEDDFNENLTDLNNYREIIDDKKKELESRIEELKKETTEKIEEKVKEEIDNLLDKFKF